MAGLPKADDLAAELGVEDLYEFLGVRSDSTDKEVGYKRTLHAAESGLRDYCKHLLHGNSEGLARKCLQLHNMCSSTDHQSIQKESSKVPS